MPVLEALCFLASKTTMTSCAGECMVSTPCFMHINIFRSIPVAWP